MESNFTRNSIKAIRYSEKAYYPEEWTFCAHTHDCYHMFCVYSEAVELEVDGVSYYCTAGSAVIVPPFTVHQMKAQENGTPEILEIMFELSDEVMDQELRVRGVLVALDDFCIHCFDQVEIFANSREERLRKHAYRFLDAGLAQICITEEDTNPFVLNAQFIDMEGFSDVTKSVIIYVDRHYQEQFTLDDIAKELGYNTSYLCTLFKRETLSTINDYLNLVRIWHFVDYYSFSDREISFICRYCGFTSASHFNRTFKKFLGTSPRQYKRFRFPHFNSNVLISDIENDENSYDKLKGILERMVSPATHLDVPSFQHKGQEDT